MTTPTIAVKESLDDLKGIGPSTGISGFKLVYVIGKGLYQYKTGDQSGNVGTDTWVAPSEDTSGKSGAWNRIERTGLDANVVSGTAGTNGNLGQWNADGDLVDGPDVLDEDDMSSDSAAAVPTQQSVKAYALTGPGTSSDPALAFDTWRTPNANRPTLVAVDINTQTDGTTIGRASVDVDESGGTTADYSHDSIADDDSGAGVSVRNSISVIIPAGGAYQINNQSDPNSVNAIVGHREFTL